MKFQESKPLKILIVVALSITVAYGGFEFYTHQNAPENEDYRELIQESFDISEKIFEETYREFTESSIQLKNRIEEIFSETISRQLAHREMENYPFWGTSLYRNGNLFTWNGFALHNQESPEVQAADSLQINIYRSNNVTYLLGNISFEIADDDNFTLYTSTRLEQDNIIPIAWNQDLNLNRDPRLHRHFPVYFNFYGPEPDQVEYYRKLQTANSDSIGIVYALEEDVNLYVSGINALTDRWRTIFHFAFFLLGTALFFLWVLQTRSWINLILQLIVIFIAWIYFFNSQTPVIWITHFYPELSAEQFSTFEAISYYSIHAIFVFLIAFTVITTLSRKWSITDSGEHFQMFIYSFLFGGINVAFIIFFLFTTQNTAAIADIALHDLELLPGLASWILFVATGFFISSVTALLVFTWWFLFVSEKDKTAVIGVIGFVSFFLFYFLSDQLLPFSLFESWKFLLSFGLFLVAMGGAVYIFRYPESVFQMSGFRLLLMASFLGSASGYLIYANAFSGKMDNRLITTTEEFLAEEEDSARDITFSLLSAIEQRMIFLSDEDIRERITAVQSQFQRAVQSSLREDWRRFSYDIQMLDANGNLISDFATNLDSPGTGFYNFLGLETSYRQEQIRRQTNRPVVQERPGSLTRDEYLTFYRGWIAIYDDINPDNIIAWIVAAVYIERPDFNKPIRAVLAASTVEDWKTSYYLGEFTNGMLTKSAVKGIYANQPVYNRLPDRHYEIAHQDSIAFISNLTANGTFRELLLKESDEVIYKASTPVPGFNSHLFAFFKFNVVILITGLILFPVFSFLGLKTFHLFNQSRRFQSRLLDGLAFATLLFLVVLIIATQFAVSNQNESNLQRDIVTKLDNLADAIHLERQQANTFTDEFIPLSRATIPLDTDAIFYRNQLVSESTTPQIFSQNLLPRMLPYEVYDFLYNRQRNHVVRTIDIGDETLLIGYRLIQNENNEPLGVIAIPTFLQSPLYTEQLLETTSYLLAFYLLIFTIFIIATVIISNRMTKPLQYIQDGLNKISGGDLETKIPVRSQDEIGSLSNAYNVMVEKLKELQINLAEAEREAAWKEMAQQVAHEIKNPLTPMKLNLQHLKRQLDNEPDDSEKFRGNVERVTMNIIEQIESLNKIASDFSKFARPIREEFSEVELNELIRSVVDFYKPDAPGQISHDLYPEPLKVMGSSDELRRTLINLVKNGFEASVDGDTKIAIRSYKNGKYVNIEVEDNGSGISEEDKDKIFVPNFSTKSSGTGLGLAITKQIIEAHQGRITFHSEINKGSVFKIELPLMNNIRSQGRV
jgi:signal transduction histidine kinase